jgi:TatA/E family protein of Tat protein translocase
MPNVGWPELLVVLVIALVIFGPKRLPDMGRQLGRGLREFKKATSEIQDHFDMSLEEKDDKKGARTDTPPAPMTTAPAAGASAAGVAQTPLADPIVAQTASAQAPSAETAPETEAPVAEASITEPPAAEATAPPTAPAAAAPGETADVIEGEVVREETDSPAHTVAG